MDWLKMLAIAGMNGGGSGGGSGGGVSPEEVTTIVKEQLPGGVGYREYVEVYENPLVWNGDVEGRILVDMPGANGEAGYVKISDTIPTDEDFGSGGVLNVVASGKAQSVTFTADNVGAVSGILLVADAIMVVPEEAAGKPVSDEFPLIFPEAGMYTMWQKSGGITYLELSVNGYEGFRFSKNIAHKIDETLLPDKVTPVVSYIEFINGSGGYHKITAGADFATLKKAIENGNPTYLCDTSSNRRGYTRFIDKVSLANADGTTYDAAVFLGLICDPWGSEWTLAKRILHLTGSRAGYSTETSQPLNNLARCSFPNTFTDSQRFNSLAYFSGGILFTAGGRSVEMNVDEDRDIIITDPFYGGDPVKMASVNTVQTMINESLGVIENGTY